MPNKEQLCWTCKNATNRNNCVWVRTLKELPAGAVRDSVNFIVECPLYKADLLCFSKREFNLYIANKFNLSVNKVKSVYFRLLNIFKDNMKKTRIYTYIYCSYNYKLLQKNKKR